MNILQIFSEIEKQDPEIYGRVDTRRKAMREFANLGKKVALTSLPFALGSMFQKAYGQTPGTAIVDVLNFALTLEHLEYNFYKKALESSGLVPTGAATGAITTIRDHEKAHVDFLTATITSLGGTPVVKAAADFDFTAGGAFANVFSDYATFLAVAQAFEDTGVRAYKGQAGNLMSNDTVLTAALNIHSVEARHASHIRQMRKANNFGDVKPWITGKDPGLGAANAAVAPIYNGEENTTQATINIVNINGMSISVDAASESFDEPLDMATVLMIVDPFIL